LSYSLHELALKVTAPAVVPAAVNYRPPSWPPPPDWPVVVDKDGTVVSVWSDPLWDLTPWGRHRVVLNFGDGTAGRSEPLDQANADLLRLAIGWLIWGPRGYSVASTIHGRFTALRAVVALCSQNGIRADTLMRFPRVAEQLPAAIGPSRWEVTIGLLHRLFEARESLGFIIADATLLKRLSQIAPDHETVQTPYIPPAIWVYQVGRLRECIDDFIEHKDNIEECFRFLLNAYVANFGSLEAALAQGKDGSKGPFGKNSALRPGCKYLGTFADTADRFGISDLLGKWVHGWRTGRISMFSAYLSLVTVAGLAYIANFTLQRKEEVASIRASCLLWEEDEKLGRVPIICGETTKTDSDSDARWVTSPSVDSAVQALTIIAKLRVRCDASNRRINPTQADQNDPYLFSTPTEPWGLGLGKARRYEVRTPLDDLQGVAETYPTLFDSERLRITSEDLKLARRMTPNLPEDSFAVGKVWPLAWHQYRRTAAVNMFASGYVSDSSMQQLMKHCTRLMPLYYGQGHSRLNLNQEVEAALVTAMYEGMAQRMQDVVSDRFVSPHSPKRKEGINVAVVSVADVKSLAGWAKAGKVHFRETRLGGCMKAGPCEYGGVESVTSCAGDGTSKPCNEALYDRKKEPQVRSQLLRTKYEMTQLVPTHPRYSALAAECKAMENYLDVLATEA